MTRIAALLPLLLTSCLGIIVDAGTHGVPVDSVPRGAVVSYRGADVGTTPCTVIANTSWLRVSIRMPGYHDQVVLIGREVNGMVIGSTNPCLVALTPTSEPAPGLWVRPPLDEEPHAGATKARTLSGPPPRAMPQPAAETADG